MAAAAAAAIGPLTPLAPSATAAIGTSTPLAPSAAAAIDTPLAPSATVGGGPGVTGSGSSGATGSTAPPSVAEDEDELELGAEGAIDLTTSASGSVAAAPSPGANPSLNRKKGSLYTADDLRVARDRMPNLWQYMVMPASEFSTLSFSTQNQGLHMTLGVPERVINKRTNATTTLKGLREVFCFPWVSKDRNDVVDALLDSQVICKVCYGSSARHNTLLASPATLRKHESSGWHVTCAKRFSTRQVTLGEVGMKHLATDESKKRDITLSVGSLLAGGEGAAGLPHTALPVYMNSDFRAVSSRAGAFPSAKCIADTFAPHAVVLVRQEISKRLADVDHFSLAIDGGGSELADGLKVVAVVAMSPEFEHDLLLSLTLLRTHETAAVQADALHDTLKLYDVPPSKVLYVVADNASVNPATVDRLRAEPYSWTAEYVRCMPHCLNLVMRAFLTIFETEYNMATHLRTIRSFIKAGGGASRRRTLAEYGVTLSGIDFSDTRWQGFIVAIQYMASDQTTAEMAKAKSLLAAAAARGDESAAAALAEPGALQSHWCAVFEAVESIGEDTDESSKCCDIAVFVRISFCSGCSPRCQFLPSVQTPPTWTAHLWPAASWITTATLQTSQRSSCWASCSKPYQTFLRAFKVGPNTSLWRQMQWRQVVMRSTTGSIQRRRRWVPGAWKSSSSCWSDARPVGRRVCYSVKCRPSAKRNWRA